MNFFLIKRGMNLDGAGGRPSQISYRDTDSWKQKEQQKHTHKRYNRDADKKDKYTERVNETGNQIETKKI